MSKKQNIDWRVYGLTDNYEFAKKLVEAKVGVLQYRDKQIEDEKFVKIARQIKSLCDQNNVCFIINDRYKLVIKVSSGTYIRSLAEEIGDRLGVPATVKN